MSRGHSISLLTLGLLVVVAGSAQAQSLRGLYRGYGASGTFEGSFALSASYDASQPGDGGPSTITKTYLGDVGAGYYVTDGLSLGGSFATQESRADFAGTHSTQIVSALSFDPLWLFGAPRRAPYLERGLEPGYSGWETPVHLYVQGHLGLAYGTLTNVATAGTVDVLGPTAGASLGIRWVAFEGLAFDLHVTYLHEFLHTEGALTGDVDNDMVLAGLGIVFFRPLRL